MPVSWKSSGPIQYLFRVVQLAVALVQHQDGGLGLSVGDEIESLRLELGMTAADIDVLVENMQRPPLKIWDPPGPSIRI